MKNPKLASRYAQALYDFSVETDAVESVYHDILKIDEVLDANKELRTVLESPIIPHHKKINIVNEIFQENLSETTFKFFELIVKKRRTPQLLLICRQFVKIYYKEHNIKEAHITSAHQLSDKMVHYLKTYLEKDSPYTFKITLRKDSKIIGGLIIKVDDYYFNAGIQAKINKLKAEFSRNAYAAGF
ncbi:MAG: ATP synthase F1 subunit delta [Bacteroidetes bacterium]|nr:ATP synthase F1 subunit delta [Bacteroidota bacterium]MCL2302642.1 ATP synthase F1 subunit delta [Lentimicrobiaceae bacterium]